MRAPKISKKHPAGGLEGCPTANLLVGGVQDTLGPHKPHAVATTHCVGPMKQEVKALRMAFSGKGKPIMQPRRQKKNPEHQMPEILEARRLDISACKGMFEPWDKDVKNM